MQPPVWDMSVPVSNTWSLNVEEHCYLLLSLVAALAVLRGRAALVLGVLSLLTLMAIVIHRHFDHSSDIPWLLNSECAATSMLASAAYRLRAKGEKCSGMAATSGDRSRGSLLSSGPLDIQGHARAVACLPLP